MEILAIVILGFSAIVGFSTNDRKPKPKTNPHNEQDPDLAFTESYDLNDSNSKE